MSRVDQTLSDVPASVSLPDGYSLEIQSVKALNFFDIVGPIIGMVTKLHGAHQIYVIDFKWENLSKLGPGICGSRSQVIVVERNSMNIGVHIGCHKNHRYHVVHESIILKFYFINPVDYWNGAAQCLDLVTCKPRVLYHKYLLLNIKFNLVWLAEKLLAVELVSQLNVAESGKQDIILKLLSDLWDQRSLNLFEIPVKFLIQ